MITVNEYFEGKVKSLGFELNGTPITAGVVLPDTYQFSTEKEEHITVTAGGVEVRLPGEEWQTVGTGDTILIPAKTVFYLKVAKPASYICIYS